MPTFGWPPTWALVVAYRLGLCCFLQTSFVPDEYYQGVEPAYSLVFGGGSPPTWEWTDDYRIRSYVLLLPHLCFFAAVRVFSLDAPWVVRHGPRVVQSLLTAAGDMSLFALVDRMHLAADAQISQTTDSTKFFVLGSHLLSWSASYCGGRTLANSTEMSLTCMLLLAQSCASADAEADARPTNKSCAPPLGSNQQRRGSSSLLLYVVLSTLLVMTRPTAILLAAPAFVCFIWHNLQSCGGAVPAAWSRLVVNVLFAAVPTALACLAIDSSCYGAWTCTPCNFVTVNVWHNASALFGTQPWHWNFSQGLPTVLGLYTPVVFWAAVPGAGLWPSHPVRTLAGLSLLYAALLHCASSHQEIRFLLPCLPGLHILVGAIVERWVWREARAHVPATRARFPLPAALLCGLVAVAHVFSASYLLSRHQAGPEAAMRYLASFVQQQQQYQQQDQQDHRVVYNIHILAPCFSFPGRSFLHVGGGAGVTLHALECSPFVRSEDAALLRSSPAALMQRTHGEARWGKADLVLTFDAIAARPGMAEELQQRGLVLAQSFPHAVLRYDFDNPEVYQSVFLYSSIS